MSATPEQRAAWIAGVRKILGILEGNPELPLPENGDRHALTWWAICSGPREIAALEKALREGAGVRLAGAIDPENDNYYNLDGELDGMPVRIHAWTSNVAVRKVTGTRVVEDVEWVRLPVPDDEAQEGPVEE